MKKLLIILSFMFLFQISRGQDSIRRFEFGATLLTVNSFNNAYSSSPDRGAAEFINGLFFRYTKKRIGLRILASYSDNSATYSTPPSWSDGSNGDVHNRDLRIGAGAQYSLLKRKQWFYGFFDLYYRHLSAIGHNSGTFSGASEQITKISNGFDSFFGLGFKLKIFKNVYLSPEIGYYITDKFVHQTTVPFFAGQLFSDFHYNEINVNPAFKVHLTVRF